MAIYRGAGGSGDAINDASSEALLTVQAKNAALAAQAAAEAAQTAAELAETNAETAEANAETAQANAETAETNAETAQAAAEAAQTAAEAAQAAAEAAQTAAETAETNAETAETNAETAETNAAASAALANDWATKTSGAVAGGEYSAKYHAQQASSSASAASTSASNAATSESNAASSASAAAASYDNFDDRYLGAKSSNPTLDNDGNALLTGALYYNTTAPEMRVYNGSSWTFIGSGSSAGVESFNTRTGAVTLSSSDVTTALTYTPLAPSAIGTTVQAYDADLTTLGAGGSSARSFLGLAIGTDVQAYDAQLADIAGLTPTDNNFIVGNGTNFVTESGSTARTSLGLGTIATQDASNVTITGGSVSGITDLAIADGGTGASDAPTARTNLGLGSIATQDASNVAITGGSINGTAIGGSTAAAGTFTSLSDSGNLTFTGTGNRITGDFSNATVANRVAFQSSTTNGNTTVYAIPNGTATTAGFFANTDSALTNGSEVRLSVSSTEVALQSTLRGTGTYLPITMYTGSVERLRIDTSGITKFRSTGSAYDSTPGDGVSDGLYLQVDSSGIAHIDSYAGSGSTSLAFGTNASSGAVQERMRIDSSGNVGIGNTVSSTINAVNGAGNLVVGSGSGSEGITIYTGTADTGGIAFADGTTTTDTYRGYINYVHNTDHMAFWTSATERMRITSAGNLQFNSGYGSVATAYGCRAWVNFDGTANTNLTGTYSQTGTTVTVTITGHGYITGQTAQLDFTTGTAVDGSYTVTVTDANTFTVTQASRTTSGNVTSLRSTIRGSANVSSITDNGTGLYTVNFVNAMPDTNYAASGIVQGSSNGYLQEPQTQSKTASALQVATVSNANVLFDAACVYVMIYR